MTFIHEKILLEFFEEMFIIIIIIINILNFISFFFSEFNQRSSNNPVRNGWALGVVSLLKKISFNIFFLHGINFGR